MHRIGEKNNERNSEEEVPCQIGLLQKTPLEEIDANKAESRAAQSPCSSLCAKACGNCCQDRRAGPFLATRRLCKCIGPNRTTRGQSPTQVQFTTSAPPRPRAGQTQTCTSGQLVPKPNPTH